MKTLQILSVQEQLAISLVGLWLLADNAQRRKMGQAGRDRVEKLFSYEAMVAAMDAMYGEVNMRWIWSSASPFSIWSRSDGFQAAS